MSDITKDQVVEWLSGQSVIEIADLVKELEEKACGLVIKCEEQRKLMK